MCHLSNNSLFQACHLSRQEVSATVAEEKAPGGKDAGVDSIGVAECAHHLLTTWLLAVVIFRVAVAHQIIFSHRRAVFKISMCSA